MTAYEKIRKSLEIYKDLREKDLKRGYCFVVAFSGYDTAECIQKLIDDLDEKTEEINRLKQWQQNAFDAHPNIDLDIENFLKKHA